MSTMKSDHAFKAKELPHIVDSLSHCGSEGADCSSALTSRATEVIRKQIGHYHPGKGAAVAAACVH